MSAIPSGHPSGHSGKAYKQEKPVVSYRLTLRFGTDLLSHVLPQYHRLWWA